MPIIVVTGTMSEEYAANIIKIGADDYILKDRLTRLPAATEAAIEHRRTERKAAQTLQKLAASEERYRQFMDRISDGFLSLDTKLNVMFSNQAAGQMLGIAPEKMYGRDLPGLFPNANQSGGHNKMLKALSTGRNIHTEEYSNVMKNWVSMNIYPSATGLSVFFRDITEEKEAKEKLRLSEEKYRMFIQRITDAFIALDKEWRYTYLNQQAEELIRMKAADVIGRNVWDVFPEAVGSPTYHAFHQAMQEQVYVFNEDHYAPLDLWQENHIYPSAEGLSVFIRNVTEKKRLEFSLQEQEKKEQLKVLAAIFEAREKERNAIGEELHDNVNQILVGASMLLKGAGTDTKKLMEVVPDCCRYLQDAINENRKLSHELVTPDLGMESLSVLLQRLLKSLLDAQGIETIFRHGDFEDEALTREQQLTVYRIFQEQLTNIQKHAKATQVTITLDLLPDHIFRMRITDNGAGASVSEENFGIGLRNISSRLRLLNGRLMVTTAPQKGFSLLVEFPVI